MRRCISGIVGKAVTGGFRLNKEDKKAMKEKEKMHLEEACRQWCDFIDEAPERRSGKGFADFYGEIKRQMICDYSEEIHTNG